MTHRTWIYATGFFASVGLLLAGLVAEALAQWTVPFRALNRGVMVHDITNKGMSGRRDHGSGQEPYSFSYPVGKNLLVYSGGFERNQWNNKCHSAGEGIWIMTRTGGAVKTAYAGTNIEPSDVVSMPHDVRTYPEAYLGAAMHHEWALGVRASNGARIGWTHFISGSDQVFTNYWPAIGALAGSNVPLNHPAIIWNYRWNEYRSGQPFTDRIAGGQLPQLSAPAWAEGLAEADFPDVIGISKTRSSANNMQWTRRWYQWGHAHYDPFIINENVVENIGSATADEVYVVIKNRMLSGASYAWFNGYAGVHRLTGERLPADDYVRSTVAPNYRDGGAPLGNVKPAGSALGRQLADQGHAMVYIHDGNKQSPTFAHNDWGDPWINKYAQTRLKTDQRWVNEGYFNHPAYFGLGVVDAFPPFNRYGGADPEIYVAPHNNPNTAIDESQKQPASITMWRFNSHTEFDQPDPGKNSDVQIWDMLTQGGYMAEPEFNDAWTQFVTFGPYRLAPGEKAKIVVAYVGGMGAYLPKYSDYRRYARPFEFAWMNMYDGAGRSPVDYRDRQQELPAGEQAMFENLQKVIKVYNWGLRVPNDPPNIRTSFVSNLEGKSVIAWSAFGADSPNPDYTGAEAQDILGYRIYISRTENQGPFELAAEFTIADAKAGKLPAGVKYSADEVFATVPTTAYPDGIPLKTNRLVSGMHADAGAEIKGRYTFTDAGSRAGFPTWYHVRYYTSGHADWKGQGPMPSFESAPGPMGVGGLGQTTGVVPVVPSAEVFNRMEEKIKVVPNPFRMDMPAHSYLGQQNIRFTNLPSRCQIDIYDAMGQRVWTQFLDNLTVGELTWLQFTENRPSNFGQAVFPGVYFWKVTSLMPESMNKTQTGTLLIIK